MEKLLCLSLVLLFAHLSLADEVSSDRKKVEFFEKLYEMKIEGVKPLEQYDDPDSFYSSIAKKVGIPKKAFDAVEKKYGWKQSDEFFLTAMVKGGWEGDYWGVMVTKIPAALKEAKSKEEKLKLLKGMEMKMVLIGYDGAISFPENPGVGDQVAKEAGNAPEGLKVHSAEPKRGAEVDPSTSRPVHPDTEEAAKKALEAIGGNAPKEIVAALLAQDNADDELSQVLARADKKNLAFSPGGHYMAEFARSINVWSLKEKSRVHRFVAEGTTLAVAFTPDGTEIVSASGEGNLDYVSTIKAWNLKTGEARTIGKCMGSVTDFSFSPDRNRLAAAVKLNVIGSAAASGDDEQAEMCGGRIHVWRMSDGRELLKVDFKLPGLRSKMAKMFPPDPDKDEQRQLGVTLDAAYEEATSNVVPVRLNFSPDGKQLVTQSSSGQRAIIDSNTGHRLQGATDASTRSKERKKPESVEKSQSR